MNAGSGAVRRCSQKPDRVWPSVKVLFALVARADDENQIRRAYVEAKHVPGGAKRDDEFTQC